MWRLLCIAVKSRTFAAEFENNKNVTIQTQKHFHGYESAFFLLSANGNSRKNISWDALVR